MVRGVNESELFDKRLPRFNVMFKSGQLDSRVLASYLAGCKSSDIEWVWIVKAARRATAAEIKQLCAGTFTL